MGTFTIGQFVHLDGSGVGVVVMLPNNKADVPDEHVGVWFGTTTETGSPVICTVPAEYFKPATTPTIQH